MLSGHCKERMLERNVTTDDILNVLIWGNLKESQANDNDQEFKCKLTGNDTEGDDLTIRVVVSIKEDSVICITVY